MTLQRNPSFQEELSSKLKDRKRRGLSTGFTSDSDDSDEDQTFGGLDDDDGEIFLSGRSMRSIHIFLNCY